jgi:hypothetical protein
MWSSCENSGVGALQVSVKVLEKNPTLNYNEHEKAGGDFPKNANGVLVLKRK